MEREGETLASTTTKKAPRNRSLGFLSAAIKLLLRRHGSKRPISAAANNKVGWTTLVGGVRPFRLVPPPCPPQHLSPPRRHPESRYASAVDLQAIDGAGPGDGVEVDSAAGREPSAIDVRAEEFIARFYEEMRLQDVDG